MVILYYAFSIIVLYYVGFCIIVSRSMVKYNIKAEKYSTF